MAKNVKIKEGSGAWQTESTDIIKTQLVEGGTQKWVPEEQYKSLLEKKVLNVTANGTYIPSSFDCDCFSKVAVKLGDGSNEDGSNKYKGPGTVTGTDPDTGEPTSVSTDEDGNIQFNQIPSFIKVTTKPTLSVYDAGDTINYDGMIVCAYKNDGSAFPVQGGGGTFGNQIPSGELDLPLTVAPSRASFDAPVNWNSIYSASPYTTACNLNTYPDYRDTGDVTITSIGSLRSAYEYALGLSGASVEFDASECEAELETFFINYGNYPGVVWMTTDGWGHAGWAPFTITAFTGLSVGDTVTLGTVPSPNPTYVTYATAVDGVITVSRCTVDTAGLGDSGLIIGGKFENNVVKVSNINA